MHDFEGETGGIYEIRALGPAEWMRVDPADNEAAARLMIGLDRGFASYGMPRPDNLVIEVSKHTSPQLIRARVEGDDPPDRLQFEFPLDMPLEYVGQTVVSELVPFAAIDDGLRAILVDRFVPIFMAEAGYSARREGEVRSKVRIEMSHGTTVKMLRIDYEGSRPDFEWDGTEDDALRIIADAAEQAASNAEPDHMPEEWRH